ncbi:NifB/NifX family molybdenum-iron cluster-binding protein [bacterium]|nr:NifB/NifX family molybdenum-iron cluster-binding protein [bacterium]
MRICIPTSDGRGLDADTYGHVGGAPFYTIVDTDSDQVEVVRNHDRHEHGHGGCGPGAHIRGYDVDAVTCSDIGRRAFSSLEKAGIAVFLANEGTAREIVTAAREERLRPLSADEVCAGHGRGRALESANDRRRTHVSRRTSPTQRDERPSSAPGDLAHS